MTSDIRLVRGLFFEEFDSNPDLYDYEDVLRVAEEDGFVQRFILFHNQGPNKGLQQLKECLQWRKSYGVNTFNHLWIPREIYQTGIMFSYLPDKEGAVPIYFRIKMYRNVKLFEERTRQFLVSMIEKTDRNHFNSAGGWSMILDFTGAKLENVDIATKLYILNVTRSYYPLGCKYIILYNLPFMLNLVAKKVMSALPGDLAKSIRFYGQDELFDLFDKGNLPDFMDGDCHEPYRKVPKGAKTYLEIGQRDFGLTEDKANQLFKLLERFADPQHSVEVDVI